MGKLIAVALLILVLIAGGVYFFNRTSKPTPTPVAPVTPTTEVTTSPTTAAGTTSANQTQNNVTLTRAGFAPATLTIKAGQTVTWTNKSGETATVNSDPHPTHTNYPPLNLGQFTDGATLSLTFPTPGTYGYHNHLNPSERGTIIVQ